MERSALGRSILLIAVPVASVVLTGQSTFAGTTECRGSPGSPAAQGMHWYYRVDRTNNRQCWYLQSAGLKVRSHESVAQLKPRPQTVVEPSLPPSQSDDVQTSPSQPATAEGILVQPSEPAIGAPSEPHFTARWPDLAASVDLGASNFAPPPSDYSGEPALSYSEQPALSTQLVLPDTISRLPHKSANGIKFGSVFIAGAISVILFAGLLKLIRALSSSLARPRPKSKLDDDSEISLSELMWALRRIDDSLKGAENRSYSPRKPRKVLATERI